MDKLYKKLADQLNKLSDDLDPVLDVLDDIEDLAKHQPEDNAEIIKLHKCFEFGVQKLGGQHPQFPVKVPVILQPAFKKMFHGMFLLESCVII